MQTAQTVDVAVIGGGAAGLSAALSLPQQIKVALFVKRQFSDCASAWAQGGIAAALSPADSASAHAADTLHAGDGLCDARAVRHMTESAAAAISWLDNMGAPFNREAAAGNYALAREGGHSARRIVHADDMTGQAVVTALGKKLQTAPNIQLQENSIAINLHASDDGRCCGFYVLHIPSGAVHVVNARAVILATGGASKVYLYATTPPDATGDGMAMAYRIGCAMRNMEFVQFHPTCLYHPQAPSFLISEAMRGEGARLINSEGAYFLDNAAATNELSPRDVVARAIDAEMKRSGTDCVFLDLSAHPLDFWQQRFPTIMRRCAKLGIDSSRIPVVPAAHYTCGGVRTDLHGQTDLLGLYAAGETASTGLHGANRLASNSLVECIIGGRAAAAAIAENLPPPIKKPMTAWDERRISAAAENIMVAHNWEELRRLMWNYVGIVRSDERLTRARRRLMWIGEEIEEHYRRYAVSRDFLEMRNLAQCAQLIVEGALSRRESRGLHFNMDCPHKLSQPHDTLLCRDDFIRRRQAINSVCPFSGRPITANSLADFAGQIIGFCNPQCRDDFMAAAANHFADARPEILSAREKLLRRND